MNIDFTGKRILVTGGTRGIGRAVVEYFLEAGARVAVNGSSAQSTAQALAEIGQGERMVAAPGSVSSVAGCHAVVDAALAGLGGLDVLVNNAGCDTESPVEGIDEAMWDRIVDTNLKGAFFTTQRALPALQESRGSIVNMASVLGLVGAVDESMYCATKAGLIALTRAHALEFAPHVRVNAVCPGVIDTDMLRTWAEYMTGSVAAGYEILGASNVFKRVAHVREIAGPVLYLASDMASFVTGSIHVVDGAMIAD